MSQMRSLPYILMILTVISMSKLCGWADRAERQCFYIRRKPPQDSSPVFDKTGDYYHGPPTLHVKQSKLSSKTSTEEEVFIHCLENIFGSKFILRRKKI